MKKKKALRSVFFINLLKKSLNAWNAFLFNILKVIIQLILLFFDNIGDGEIEHMTLGARIEQYIVGVEVMFYNHLATSPL